MYKRQTLSLAGSIDPGELPSLADLGFDAEESGWLDSFEPVSYTHLTLPTSDLV